MTKVQIKNAVLSALTDHKAKAALTEQITELLELYASKATKGAEKRDKVIDVEGVEYVWCNRHEVYEVSTNFKTNKADCCLLAHKVWVNYGTQIKTAQDALDAVIAAEDYEAIKPANIVLQDLKELRGGRYNFEDNKLQFAELENFDYDVSNHIAG